MNKIYNLSRLFILIVLFSILWKPGNIKAQANNNDLIQMWERARDYSLEVARTMPENLYDFKPRKTLFTFGEQWLHVIDNINRLHHNKILEKPQPSSRENAEDLTKQQIIQQLTATFDSVSCTLQKLDKKSLKEELKFREETLTKKDIIHLMRDHNTHHRAQAILYLRLNGIDAPSYVGW